MKNFWLLRAIKYFLIRGGIDNSEKSDTEPLMQARTRLALDFPIVDILRKIQDSQIKSFQQNRPSSDIPEVTISQHEGFSKIVDFRKKAIIRLILGFLIISITQLKIGSSPDRVGSLA